MDSEIWIESGTPPPKSRTSAKTVRDPKDSPLYKQVRFQENSYPATSFSIWPPKV